MTCKKVLLSFSKIKGYVSHISCTFLFENKDRNGNLFCPLQLGTPFLLISGSVRNVCHVFCLCLLYTTNIGSARLGRNEALFRLETLFILKFCERKTLLWLKNKTNRTCSAEHSHQ